MSKMKHLLRKLHIGSETRPVINPDPSPSPSSSTSSTIRAVDQVAEQRTVGISSESSSGGATGGVDFNFLEEEFQVQLALAISASDPSSKRDDPETVQIKAAKRMSLGCPPSVSADDTETLAEFLSLRYWNYNSVNYDEKVMDGFYDVYGITSNSMTQGKMPLLVDLQAISTSDKFDYEVVLVNRSIDPELQKLEERAYAISMECGVSDQNGLIQIIADLVVGKMGGAVGDADEMLKRWTFRSYELRNSLNTIVLPLGRLDIGLSRHRALLFKVLADRINLPCMMVKGSYYTGTDEGAVNLIKFGDGSEYIIDLMGAPGTLIPAEAPCSHLPNSGLDGRCFENAMETSKDSSLVLGDESGSSDVTLDLGKISKTESSMLEQAPCIGFQPEDVNKNLTEKREVEKFELDFGNLLPSLPQPHEGSSDTHEKVSSAQKIKVKDVSKYVISAAKDPEFAQKLHAVLLESGAAPPANLFLNINFQDVGNQRVLNQVHLLEGITIDDGTFSHPDNLLPKHEQSLMPSTSTGLQSLNNHGYDIHRKQSVEEPTDKQKNVERSTNETQVLVHSDTTSEGFVLVSGGGSSETMQIDGAYAQIASADSSRMFREDSNTEQSHESSLPFAAGPSQTQLGEVAEWEIPWEDLQIGERIGIGSYGEVYHADWNGTEVAVKKFLVQDFTGYALVQFKCEVEIMLRLRHPNVVLFMGAVTRPPNLSILTEFLPRGSLYRLLHRPNHHLDEKRRLRMALDVAKGMNYLHTSHPPIVHRDLKSPNLLVDKNWVVKVCDFGLSRVKHNTFLSSKSTAGTPEWMAPEVLRNERANEKCDIYSFGVILWELTTLRVPWSGLNPMQVVGAVGFQNRRLDIPEDVDSSIAQIICDCWQSDPQLRPTFAQLIHRLRRVPHLYTRITNSTSEITD